MAEFDDLQKRLEELNNEKQKVLEEFQKDGQKAMKELFMDFFTKHPEIGSFRWTQYTPFFNDGDVCRFNVHGLQFKLADYNENDEKADHGDYGDGYDEFYYGDSHKGKPWFNDMKKLHKGFESMDDEIMEAMFGDGVEVTITRKGIKVEDCDDHD